MAGCSISDTGDLTTMNGYSVLDAGGAPILLDAAAGAPEISRDGMITQNNAQIGALGLYTIDDDAKLTRYNNSGVIPDKPATAGPRLHRERRRAGLRGRLERQSDHGNDQADQPVEAFDGVTSPPRKPKRRCTDAIKTLGSSG